MLRKLCLAWMLGLSLVAQTAMGDEILKDDFFGKSMAYAQLPGYTEPQQDTHSESLLIGLRNCLAQNPPLKAQIINRAQDLDAQGFKPSRILFETDPQQPHVSTLKITFEYMSVRGEMIRDYFEAFSDWNPDDNRMRQVSDLEMDAA